jgi:hypothetical protein
MTDRFKNTFVVVVVIFCNTFCAHAAEKEGEYSQGSSGFWVEVSD